MCILCVRYVTRNTGNLMEAIWRIQAKEAKRMKRNEAIPNIVTTQIYCGPRWDNDLLLLVCVLLRCVFQYCFRCSLVSCLCFRICVCFVCCLVLVSACCVLLCVFSCGVSPLLVFHVSFGCLSLLVCVLSLCRGCAAAVQQQPAAANGSWQQPAEVGSS